MMKRTAISINKKRPRLAESFPVQDKTFETSGQPAEIPCCLCAPCLPDEALISEVGRYHILHANRTSRETYQELFNCAPFSLTAWIPSHISTLAKRFDGDATNNTIKILRKSTLFPLFEIFTGISTSQAPNILYKKKTPSAPKRIGAETTRLCLLCLHEDMEQFGVRYIHRSHQIPGVRICWKHDVRLIYKCPFYECIFDRPRELVLAPWHACVCKKYVFDFPDIPDKDKNLVDMSYARFTNDILMAPPLSVPSRALVDCYRKRAIELGFVRGSDMVDRNRLFTELEKFYGKAFLEQVDAAYRQKRLSGWFHTLQYQSASDVPLSRHLLFAHFLFRDSEKFGYALCNLLGDSLNANSNDPHRNKSARAPKKTKGTLSEPNNDQKAEELVRELLSCARKIPRCSVEDLWHARWGMMKKLVSKYPNAFLKLTTKLNSLKRGTGSASTRLQGPNPKDEERAVAIQSAALALYASVDKPERVSRNRLASAVSWKSNTEKRFPKSCLAFDENIESNWYFYARRIVWAKLFNKMGSESAIRALSGVEYRRGLVLLEFFRDLNTMIPLESGTIVSVLSARGIERDWIGPCPEREFPLAGRSFYNKK